LLLVGEASGANRWEQRPLYGLCLWLTRHPSQLEPLQSRLQQLGAEIVSFPVLEFAPPSRPELLERALQQLPDYHWVLFTSPNGVDRFFTALWQSGGDPRRLAQARLGVIGPGTARALEQRGLRADVVAPRAIAEGLLEALGEDQVRGRRVLLARAEEARDVLPEGLRERGATVEVVPCYRTIRPCGPPTVGPGASPDWVVLMSASAARHFAQLYPARPLPPALCIGPITAEEAVRQGYPRWETADQHHVEGVVDKLLQIVAPRHR
jgi:uroporphyrinogen III methyltransferase/synthase